MACLIPAFFGGAPALCQAQSNQTIYTDSLQNGWVNYSWATVNFSNTSPVHTGTNSISVTCLSTNYQALFLHHSAFDPSSYTNLTFWLYSMTGGSQLLQVQGTISNGTVASATHYQIPPITASNWTLITAPISLLTVGGSSTLDGFWIQSQSGSPILTFYVDDITLVAGSNAPPATNATASIVVDVSANRHPISPMIYGVAFATASEVADLNVTMNRSGGNSETRYNWLINANNHAADYYFESLANASSMPGADADSLISASKSGGAQPMITIPMIGWMPKLGPNQGKLASYSISKYGPQTGSDYQYMPDAGNGISVTNDTPITWNDPNDANFLTNVLFQKTWVQHLTNAWGLSANGGVRYYLMDNEHTLWYSTHRDVHPVGTTMQEIYSDITNYAAMVKGVDSNALVLGPEEWGWPGYFYSGYDQQWSGANNNYNTAQYPDRSSNGGWDYMPWLLNQLHQYQSNNGVRLLDYFTLHCYPQEGVNGAVGNTNDDSATQLLRNSTTRQFWDTNYVDPSWINSIIMLIPRMQNWVATYYPGTKIGVTEYNWGAEPYINGATAQADILGIFGRQSLDLATRWTTPDPSTPTYLAIKMYRNYDGNKSTFGDTSISAGGPNPDDVAVFAAQRTNDGSLTIMVVSKYLTGVTPLSISVSNFLGTGTAQMWQLNASNVIARLSDVSYAGGTINATVPGQSVTLFVFPAKPFTLQPGVGGATGQINFFLNGEIGQTYILQSTSNLITWLPIATNTLTSTQWSFQVSPSSTHGFYRARQGP